jgi:predicted transcriptional regulator
MGFIIDRAFMNNFNKVFMVVRDQCQKQKKLAEVSCFEVIAKEASVPLNKLGIYLNHLQDMGLIKYSMADKYVYLTSFGKKHETLIKESVAEH